MRTEHETDCRQLAYTYKKHMSIVAAPNPIMYYVFYKTNFKKPIIQLSSFPDKEVETRRS